MFGFLIKAYAMLYIALDIQLYKMKLHCNWIFLQDNSEKLEYAQ